MIEARTPRRWRERLAAGALAIGMATTADFANVPLCPNECCCATPFGIWGVIVLVNADVKRAFTIVAQGGSHG